MIKGSLNINDLFKQCELFESDLLITLNNVGKDAIEVANETCPVRTGRLRAGNKYKVNLDGITFYNNVEYAAFVEAKGYRVLTPAALYAEKELQNKL